MKLGCRYVLVGAFSVRLQTSRKFDSSCNLEGPVVEESEAEVEDEGAPDGDVVEDGPVGGVEGDLGGHHDDEDGGHHRGEEVVVSQHQTQLVRLVVIRS